MDRKGNIEKGKRTTLESSDPVSSLTLRKGALISTFELNRQLCDESWSRALKDT